MMRTVILITIVLAAGLAAPAQEAANPPQMLLRQGWAIQSSDDVRDSGATLSTPWYQPRGWYNATVPTTVFGALVQDRIYPDPYTGMNLRSVPGVSYPISTNFSNSLMPPDSPFRHSWWYRTEFKLPAAYKDKTVWLGFDGISFRANVWINGRQIASADKLAGTWRLFEFDVTSAVRPDDANALAIEVFPPLPQDLATTFVDWNPQPPDKNMGLWRDVHITATGPVALRYPFVATHLSGGAAALTVRAELKNAEDRVIEGVLKGKIEQIGFSQPVRLNPRETRVVHFTPEQFGQLKLANPRLWWPVQTGEQNLYPLELQFETDGKVSDSSSIQFGVREITSQLDDKGHRLFQVNGKNILIRGGGYSFDMLLRSTPQQQEAHLKYVRDMNLNALRFEGKLEDDHFLELCDRYGILVLAGWCCCDHWEQWQGWDREDEVIAAESLRDQLRRLARHPSVFDWLYGSDNPPPPKIERMYLDVIKEVDWPNPYQSSATAKTTTVTGHTGVKMTGPYEYVAPAYWYLDTTRGGAHGFNTETSPGPAPPPIETLRLMLPADHLWPMDSWWDYHAGGGQFKDLHVFSDALNARYGKPANVEEFARKAQVMAYESHRAMFEAYGRNKFTSTGVIQWMLNNAWPSLIWHLYDWYMRPGGTYFAAKKACEPLHVQYSYDDRSIMVVNSHFQPFPGMKVTAKVFNIDMAEKFSKQASADIPENSSTRVFELPEMKGLSSTYFVNLTLADAAGKVVSRNFYWLSTAPETLDWDKSTWYDTPTKTFADFTALNSLPKAELKLAATTERVGDNTVTAVTASNPGKTLAFAVHLKVKRGAEGDEFLPVLWEDNYFPLLPGETRQVSATYSMTGAGRGRPVGTPVVEADGWNVPVTRVQ
jgi:exo-1,4-beta-D-glucosaminidase